MGTAANNSDAIAGSSEGPASGVSPCAFSSVKLAPRPTSNLADAMYLSFSPLSELASQM